MRTTGVNHHEKGHGQAISTINQGAGRAGSYRFVTNTSCEFFPCHKSTGEELFNCLFCYCPLYSGECPGEPARRLINGHEVKDCSDCLFPHEPGNYDDIIRCLMERIS